MGIIKKTLDARIRFILQAKAGVEEKRKKSEVRKNRDFFIIVFL